MSARKREWRTSGRSLGSSIQVAPGLRLTVLRMIDLDGRSRSTLMSQPPLKSLHSQTSLSQTKIERFSRLSDEELMESLKPGQPGSLKARPDGTMIEGHHRIKVLRDRGVDVDSLPREIIDREDAQ